MTRTSSDTTFRALHQPGAPFILANAWDRGSAKMLTALGAQALATSSGAHAFTLGRPDTGLITRDEALSHASDLISATNLPVSGDFENGFGAAPDTCAETVRLSAEVGLAGICLEDTALPAKTPYAFDLAVERIRAAASAARALPRDFVLVARADGLLTGEYDFGEALRRLQAFEAAGADCLYAPGLKSAEDVRILTKTLTKPLNVLAIGAMSQLSQSDLAALGVARISLGAALARLTHQTIIDAAGAMFSHGDFSALANLAPAALTDPMLS
jgi:2-methylisocitrate lyase-like PEP mutase family enzyme